MDRLRQHCERRLVELFCPSDRPWVGQRMRQELTTIQTNGQVESFLEAQRVVQLLRDQGAACRLIGAGSCALVSYLMNLSDVDPAAHGLPYERFLETNQSRTIQFQFVAHLQTCVVRDEFSPIQIGSSRGAVSIQQATSVEAMPCLVAKEISHTISDFDLASIPLNDKFTFKTLGSDRIRETEERLSLSDMKPRCLTDIAAFTAIQAGELHEPGLKDKFIPREGKRNRGRPETWLVENTLQETRGMILFQEQIMIILNRVADIPLADAYRFIKAVCKQQWEEVAMYREWFVIRAIGNGINEPDALTLFEGIRNAATRAVCKAHHLSDAITTYQLAYLKTHFPREFSRTLQIIHR